MAGYVGVDRTVLSCKTMLKDRHKEIDGLAVFDALRLRQSEIIQHADCWILIDCTRLPLL